MGFGKACAVVNNPTNESRKLINRLVKEKNLTAVTGKGYYAFIKVSQWLKAAGLPSSEALGQTLAEQYGVAIVPGSFFSKFGDDWIRFSYATPAERTQGALERMMSGLAALAKK
jgi:aspartate/methionine/tyrosine aminotransferase